MQPGESYQWKGMKEGAAVYLTDKERPIIIRALEKVLETEPAYARADEYKKLLDRLKAEDLAHYEASLGEIHSHDYYVDEV
ncbi:hypothetical protein JQC72_12655 [Polycladomyces sp. WAk]|uniref:Uncharacterized protein n=1 Tax=Polycladomyces zharkentensis TaxID=2807616 RepID=A0ABS2WLE3_9BACL|nr:hypothetical protein [Polycladomyces sp. WAk]MBN2910348.1 hypothetical protein [Polycladomyces sp. WAk]